MIKRIVRVKCVQLVLINKRKSFYKRKSPYKLKSPCMVAVGAGPVGGCSAGVPAWSAPTMQVISAVGKHRRIPEGNGGDQAGEHPL
jgi:hypothetical protein